MNLLKNPQKVIKALTEVEGEDWLKRQKAGDFREYSVFEAIKELKKVKGSRGIPGADYSITIIYGHHGWNRYRVAASGEVEFIKLQASSPEAVKKAKAAGFEMV